MVITTESMFWSFHPLADKTNYCTIQLIISFLISRKRTVNFRNQCLGRHLPPDSSCRGHSRSQVIMSIMSSSRALCCLPSVKKQNMTSRFASLTEQDIEKHIWRQWLTKHWKVDGGDKGAVCWLRKREKTERTWGKERVGTNFENILCRSKKERIRSMYNKTIIRFGFLWYPEKWRSR